MADTVAVRRSLAERAREAWEAAQRRVSDLRLARARGEDDAPSAADVAKAKAEAELAEDRARLAHEDAEAFERAEAAEAARAAARQRRAEVQAIHAEQRRLDEGLVLAAEGLAIAFEAVVAHAESTARAEAGLNNNWLGARVTRALEAVSGAWPLGRPLPSVRPVPYRDSASRMEHPDREGADLATRLPLPPDPDAPTDAGLNINIVNGRAA